MVSCGSDRVLRLYEKTDQPLVLQDEQEEEREQQEKLATGDQAAIIPGQPGLNLPSKKTIGSEKAVRIKYHRFVLIILQNYFQIY